MFAVFESITEQIEAADQAHKAGHTFSDGNSHFQREGFIGRRFSGWKDVVEKANEPWSEGIALVEGMLHDLASLSMPAPVSRRRRACWSEDNGDELDNDRLRSGQAYWRETRREATTGTQTVALFMNVTTSAGRDTSEVMWRGVAGIVLANLLEQAGYRVEIWVLQAAGPNAYRRGPAEPFTSVTRVKAAEAPLDTATLVNSISGWFYRTVHFQTYHIHRSGQINSGLGPIASIHSVEPQLAELAGGATYFLFEGLWTREDAMNKVRTIIAQLNGQ